jgi:hypothetical protein
MLHRWVDVLFYQVALLVDRDLWQSYIQIQWQLYVIIFFKIALFLTSLDLSNVPSLISPLITCTCSK